MASKIFKNKKDLENLKKKFSIAYKKYKINVFIKHIAYILHLYY